VKGVIEGVFSGQVGFEFGDWPFSLAIPRLLYSLIHEQRSWVMAFFFGDTPLLYFLLLPLTKHRRSGLEKRVLSR